MHEIAELAHRIYDERIRDLVEPQLIGQYLVMDVLTGEFETGPNHLATAKKLMQRTAKGPRFGMRIGYPAAMRIGGGAPIAHAKR